MSSAVPQTLDWNGLGHAPDNRLCVRHRGKRSVQLALARKPSFQFFPALEMGSLLFFFLLRSRLFNRSASTVPAISLEQFGQSLHDFRVLGIDVLPLARIVRDVVKLALGVQLRLSGLRLSLRQQIWHDHPAHHPVACFSPI
jgi:hypothetical protein